MDAAKRQQAKDQGIPRTFDTAMVLVAAFLRKCEPYMEKFRDREALKVEISRLTQRGSGGLKSAIKNTGVARRVDDLGRIVIPKELRDTYGIDEGTPMEIFVDEEAGMIHLQKFNMQKCTFCDSQDDVNPFMGKYICESCVEKLFDEIDIGG